MDPSPDNLADTWESYAFEIGTSLGVPGIYLIIDLSVFPPEVII